MKKVLILFSLFFWAISAHSASLEIQSPFEHKSTGTFSVNIYADTAGVVINTLEATIDFNESILEFSGYKVNSSLIKIWVESPKNIGGKIKLSGIIPGGVSGLYDPEHKAGLNKIPVVELIFKPITTGNARFDFIESVLLQNDGLGTKLDHFQLGSSTDVTVQNIAELNEIDTKPPLPFTITLVESSIFSQTPQMLVFNTTDAESGIMRYELKNLNDKWREIDNPYPLPTLIFDRTFFIRAYDYNNNYTETEITVYGIWSPQLFAWVLLICLAFFWLRKLIK